ncbi:major facilitator superfamily domain-containing protein [Coniochaeta sp. 2T2.1]|nr:major facilitator superfamily domain-containing protein [Coniochaeta sp. 2T2.1]
MSSKTGHTSNSLSSTMSKDAEQPIINSQHSPSSDETKPEHVNDPTTHEQSSIFTTPQKRFIVLLASIAGAFSTLCSYIYYPALVPIAAELGVSITLVNLTIASYLVVAAIAPAIMGSMADQSGRRPIYMLMFALFIGANVGIALQTSFPALLVLRMLQSAGSSGLIAVAYGVIADVTTRSERGGYCGMFDLLIQFALSIGPVIGGSITQQLGWRWIFWFLVILTSSHFLLMLLFFPETQPKIVGDGSLKARGVYKSLFCVFQSREIKGRQTDAAMKPRISWPNPFACLRILGNKESLIVILLYSITYAVKMALQASLGVQCVEIYQLDYLTAGLIYLPAGVSGAVAAFLTGKYLDRTYRRSVAKLSAGQESVDGDSAEFPIEATRLKGAYVLIIASALGSVGYGLALMTKAHISVMIIMQFMIGLTTSGMFTMSATLLTDLNKNQSATAQGACSLIRCLGAGAAIAAMQPLADAAGLGWCFAVFALLLVIEVPLVWLISIRGVRWRTVSSPSGNNA